jgi:hypothetical protein
MGRAARATALRIDAEAIVLARECRTLNGLLAGASSAMTLRRREMTRQSSRRSGGKEGKQAAAEARKRAEEPVEQDQDPDPPRTPVRRDR